MIPLAPILLAGGGIALAAKAGLHKRAAKMLKKVDEKYQQFFEKNIDSQFVSQERNQQLQEFIHNDKEEANINRNLGLAIMNTMTAIVGSFFYPPLLILTAIGVLCSIVVSGTFLFHFGMLAALLLYSVGLTATISHALSPMLKLPKDVD